MSQSERKRASEWLLRLQAEEELTPRERAAFEAWLDADPSHGEAFKGLAESVQEVRRLGFAFPGRLERARPGAAWGVRAGGVVAVGLAGALLGLLFWPREAPTEHYQTVVGEQREVHLADGSVIELNTNTELEVGFAASTRKVRLIRGEALFRVAHNERKPFDVEAGGERVRAIGTAFVVRLDEDTFEVIVTEGVVRVTPRSRFAVAPANAIEAWPLSVSADQRLAAAGGYSVIEDLSAEDVARDLAWTDGMLRFEGEPLGVVVKEVSRYTGARFVITDPALEDRHVVAYLRATNLDGFIDKLRGSFPDLEVSRVGREVRIERRPDRDPGTAP